MKGHPHRNKRGDLSLLATELPTLQSPCLHQLPTELQDQETRIQHRHVDFLVNPRAAQTIQLRSEITSMIRYFLRKVGCLEVQTPIMASLAGGAVARAFETNAVEFPDRHIELRTAPELWLKRLILGGFEKIFEIGPCFRNEGMIWSGRMEHPLKYFQVLTRLTIRSLRHANSMPPTTVSRT